MHKVTNIFERYRECARHLRNTNFSTMESKLWDDIESLSEKWWDLWDQASLRSMRRIMARWTMASALDSVAS